ncbi:MAG: hypothetical protein QM740_20170 [Acidovorax sp.]
MTPAPIESAADYLLLDDTHIAPNEAGEWIKAAYEATVSSYQRLRRCWAGAFLAQLFARRPWLDAARLTLSVSFEYGDDGSYFRTGSVAASRKSGSSRTARLPRRAFRMERSIPMLPRPAWRAVSRIMSTSCTTICAAAGTPTTIWS